MTDEGSAKLRVPHRCAPRTTNRRGCRLWPGHPAPTHQSSCAAGPGPCRTSTGTTSRHRDSSFRRRSDRPRVHRRREHRDTDASGQCQCRDLALQSLHDHPSRFVMCRRPGDRRALIMNGARRSVLEEVWSERGLPERTVGSSGRRRVCCSAPLTPGFSDGGPERIVPRAAIPAASAKSESGGRLVVERRNEGALGPTRVGRGHAEGATHCRLAPYGLTGQPTRPLQRSQPRSVRVSKPTGVRRSPCCAGRGVVDGVAG